MRKLVLLIGIVLLAGCGGAGGTPATSPVQAIELAAAKLEQPGSLSFTLHGTMRNKSLSKHALPISGKGVMLLGKDGSWVWLDMERMVQIIVADHVPPDEREVVRALLDDPKGWRAEIRTIGNSSWMRIPALADIYDSKPWIRLEDDEAATGLDIALDQAPNDPVEVLPYLRAVGKVEDLGREEVGGVQTTHYRSRVVLDRVARHAPAKKRAALRKAIQRVIAETGRRTSPIEVWLDDDHSMRRIRFVDTLPPAKDEKYPTTYKMTMNLLGFGIAVDIPRPRAGQVMTEARFEELTG